MGKVAVKAPENQPTDYSIYEGEKQYWSSARNAEGIEKLAKTGIASTFVPRTLGSILELAAKKHGTNPALRTENSPALKKGETPPPALPLNSWKTWSYADYYRDAKFMAKALIASGLEQHDAISIFGFNSPEWSISLVGVILAGGKGSGIYPSDNEEQVKYKTDHSNSAVAIVETQANFDKYKNIVDELPVLKAIVTWACPPGEDIVASDGRVIKTYSFEEYLAFGKEQPDTLLGERSALIKPSHPAVLVYTSGTTGNPKAVMLSHDNLCFSSYAVLLQSAVLGMKDVEERFLSYLPLSHVAGMMIDIISPMILTSNIAPFKGYTTTYFARPYDLKLGSLVARLGAVKPTSFLGVPRVWEKFMERLKAVGASSKGLKKALAGFAKKRALKYTSTRQLGGAGKNPTGISLATKILNAIKVKLGLDKCKFFFAGAAPMTQECLNFFGGLGINVNEVYGMSETTGAATWSTDAFHVWGSIGFELNGLEVKVFNPEGMAEIPRAKDLFNPSEAEQGEICFRGRNVMIGYMANERFGEDHMKEMEEKNSSAIDANGWLHSGDKGTRDALGMFKITGRYKELIIGAGGENIAPVPIEDEIKMLCPIISNVMMVGNKRKFNVMLVTLKAVGASGELPGSNNLAPPASTASTSKTITEAMEDKTIIAMIEDAIKKTNANSSVVPSQAAKVQKFTILPRDFSVVTGELTATLKLKRGVVDDMFEPIISKMYEVKENYVNYNLAPTEGLPMGVAQEPVLEKGLSFNMDMAANEVADAEAKESA